MASPTTSKALLLAAFAGVVLLAGCGRARSAPPDLFKTGRQLVVEGEYAKAVPVLTEYIQRYPAGEHASRAGLFLGKAHVGLEQPKEARAAWERTARDHGATLEGHKCRYKLAWLSMIEGKFETALAGFAALAEAPNGPLAPESAAMARFLRGLVEAPAEAPPVEREE